MYIYRVLSHTHTYIQTHKSESTGTGCCTGQACIYRVITHTHTHTQTHPHRDTHTNTHTYTYRKSMLPSFYFNFQDMVVTHIISINRFMTAHTLYELNYE